MPPEPIPLDATLDCNYHVSWPRSLVIDDKGFSIDFGHCQHVCHSQPAHIRKRPFKSEHIGALHSEMAEAGPSQPLRTTKETHPNLPPGLILGPDGKPCKVCNSWQDWAKVSIRKKQPVASDGTAGSAGGRAAAGGIAGFAAMMSGSSTGSGSKAASGGYAAAAPQQLDRRECPADTALLGRSTWTFLHTTAAYYPIKAPPETQDNMRRLLGSLSLLYPCLPCQEDFHDKVRQHPPDVSGREGLSRWLCERHNEVNDKLGKETFACDWSNLDRRWKDGPPDGSCD